LSHNDLNGVIPSSTTSEF